MMKKFIAVPSALALGSLAVFTPSLGMLATVVVSGFLDGIHPCGIGVLLFFVTFLLSVRRAAGEILAVGGAYIAGVFSAYLLVGFGIMAALTFFPPMFMAKLGAALLAILGIVTLRDALAGTATLKIPSFSRPWIQQSLEKATIPAALAAGFVVGLCAFPCAGGIYVAIIGLLASRVDFAAGIAYLVIYNIAFVLPLAVLLFASTDRRVIEKLESSERRNRRAYKIAMSAFMLGLAAVIYFGWLGGA